MIPSYRSALVALLLGFASVAVAQTTTTDTSPGSCSAQGITADISFAARKDSDKAKGSSSRTSINATYAANVFGRAECDCDPSEASDDAIYMRLQISTGLAAGTVTNVSAWVGSGCDDYTTRINKSAVSCVQFNPMNLSSSSFNAGSGNIGVSTFFDLWVPARLLFSPSTGSCDTDATNQIYIFASTDVMDAPACTVPISERSVGASPVVDPKAEPGDSAVNLSWTIPTATNTTSFRQASYVQVLCATSDGQPVKKSPNTAYYSICSADGIERRQNIFGATSISTATDGGIVTQDLSVIPLSAEVPAPGTEPTPADVLDGGVDGGDAAIPVDAASSPSDTSIRPTNFPGLGVFSTLDQKYVCTDAVQPASQTGNVRVKGLTNHITYQFVVVTIDDYGNPTPSAIQTATPQPVEDLYGAYRSAGGKAQGFCFVATAAFGDYDHPQVRTLRAFRDRVLEESAFGRAFVRTYYRSSPPFARFIERSDFRRFLARVVLWPLVAIAALAIQLHSLTLALLFVIGAPGLLAWRRKRRKRTSDALVGAAA